MLSPTPAAEPEPGNKPLPEFESADSNATDPDAGSLPIDVANAERGARVIGRMPSGTASAAPGVVVEPDPGMAGKSSLVVKDRGRETSAGLSPKLTGADRPTGSHVIRVY